MRSEKGVINIVTVAVALPVLLLLFAIAFDFSRIPLSKALVETVLYENLSSLEPNWNCDGTQKGEPSPGGSSGGTGGGTGGNSPSTGCSPHFGLEPHAPYAYNFCFLGQAGYVTQVGGVLGSCLPNTTDSLHVFLKDNLVRPLLTKGANSLVAKLTQKGGWPYGFKTDDDVFVEYGIFRVIVGDSGQVSETVCPIQEGVDWMESAGTLTATSSQNLLRLKADGPLTGSGLCRHINNNISENQQLNIGWQVQPCAISSGCSAIHLSSAWFVGVANVKIRSYFGGLAWPGDAYGQDEYIVSSYIIKPLGNIGGIEF